MLRSLLCLFAAAALRADAPALKGLDPVLLTEGREVAGVAGLTVQRPYYLYQFASAETKARFEREPERFEIQLDGACARMGPASGVGAADRYLVHAGKIYIFASDACRRTFASKPEAHLDKPAQAPAFTAEQARAGRALLEKLTAFLGGAARVDGLSSYREEAPARVKDPQPNQLTSTTRVMVFPDRMRTEQTYQGWGTAVEVIAPNGAWYIAPSSVREFRKGQAEVLRARFARHPLTLARLRKSAATPIWSDDGRTVRMLAGGALLALEIDAKTGQPLALEHETRGPQMFLGQARFVYSDFLDTGGLKLPFKIEAWFEGQPWPGGGKTLTAVQVNEKYDEALFRPPAQGAAK